MDALQKVILFVLQKDFQLLTQHLSKTRDLDLPTYVRSWPSSLPGKGCSAGYLCCITMVWRYLGFDDRVGENLQTIAYLSAIFRRRATSLVLSPSLPILQDELEKARSSLGMGSISCGLAKTWCDIIAEDHQILLQPLPSGILMPTRLVNMTTISFSMRPFRSWRIHRKTAQYLCDFLVPHCLALSGTPIENHLLEIYSFSRLFSTRTSAN